MIKTKSLGSKLFDVINIIFTVLLIAITLYPLYYVFITSISNGLVVMRGEVSLWPKGITLESYRVILSNDDLFMAFKNSVVYTTVGTTINLIMSCLCAYPLSRKSFYGRKLITKIIIFTMLFTGGLIPTYLVVDSLGLIDTMWAILLPVAINTYNMIIIRTSFAAVPESLIESAKIDGANDFYVLARIVIPLSKAVLATMVLFYAVQHWNSFFRAMIYLNKKSKYPIQIFLRNMVVGGMYSEETSQMGGASSFKATDRTVRSATIIFSTLPILMVYPFVQRYFVKGVMIGSVKG